MTKDLAGGVEIHDSKKGVASSRLLRFRIHTKVMIFQCYLPSIRVVAGYPVSPVIPVTSVLSDSGSVFHFSGIWLDPEIESAEAQLFSCFGGGNDSSTVSISDVDPSIETPAEPVASMLLIALAKPLIKNLL